MWDHKLLGNAFVSSACNCFLHVLYFDVFKKHAILNHNINQYIIRVLVFVSSHLQYLLNNFQYLMLTPFVLMEIYHTFIRRHSL